MNVERRTAIIDKRADAVFFRLSAFVMMVVMMVFMLMFMLMFVFMVMVLFIVVMMMLFCLNLIQRTLYLAHFHDVHEQRLEIHAADVATRSK